ncbi:MAG: ferrochelatase [Chlamydiota bacterium]
MRCLLVNFGGPRSLLEIPEFLIELLCDQEVLRTGLPRSWHKFVFTRIAKKRAKKVEEDYREIGGKSPIHEDTEELARQLAQDLDIKISTFHRYLPKTHAKSLETLEMASEEEITVLPLFPQFSYATTGSIAQFFVEHLTPATCDKLRWIRSYPDHKSFTLAYEQKIRTFLTSNNLQEEEVLLFFSPHGIPQRYVKTDPYQKECEASYRAIKSAFPKALSRLCYQSKFGPGAWLKPYTEEAASSILSWHQGRKHVLFIPLSFTSDHIETLFEIEKLYLPLVKKQGLCAYRLDALNLDSHWVQGISDLLQVEEKSTTKALLRKQNRKNSRKWLQRLQ